MLQDYEQVTKTVEVVLCADEQLPLHASDDCSRKSDLHLQQMTKTMEVVVRADEQLARHGSDVCSRKSDLHLHRIQ